MNKNSRKGVYVLVFLTALLAALGVLTAVLVNVSAAPAKEYTLLGGIVLILLVMAFLIFELLRRFRRRVLAHAVDLNNEYQQYMAQWEYPFALLSSGLRVVWANEAFRKITRYEGIKGKTLEEAGLPWGQGKPDWDPIVRQIEFSGHKFKAVMTQIRLRDNSEEEGPEAPYTEVYSLSLQDITRELMLEKENFEQQGVVALLYVDNYDQILGAMNEIDRPLLEAMIFRTISDLSTNLNGIMTRLERDRFQIVFPRRQIYYLYENQFQVLEDVKKLESGPRYRITLSVGVGVDKELSEARRFARMGVDLAMGRGGDQAVVKTKDDQEFFGGLSTSVENTTRVRARLTAYALKELMEASDAVLVMGHQNPDLDVFGAALGMYRIAAELGKPAHIVMSVEKHPAVDYLYREVAGSADHRGVMIDLAEAEKLCGVNTLLILVDVNRKVIVQYPELLEKVGSLVVIDHHRAAADAVTGAEISYVEPFASSASEMVSELLQYMLDDPDLHHLEADGLFAGIALDTKNFTVKTGVRTFEAAAFLRRRGADSVRVRKMFKNDMEDYKAKAEIISGAEIVDESVAIATWQSALPNATTVAAQAADELLDVHGVKASFVIAELDHGQINVSARSLGEINVQLIMEELGGGGHLSMAGAQLTGLTLEEAREKVLEAASKYKA